jgi:hypothetical protein
MEINKKFKKDVDNRDMLLYNNSCVTAGTSENLENAQYSPRYEIIGGQVCE